MKDTYPTGNPTREEAEIDAYNEAIAAGKTSEEAHQTIVKAQLALDAYNDYIAAGDTVEAAAEKATVSQATDDFAAQARTERYNDAVTSGMTSDEAARHAYGVDEQSFSFEAGVEPELPLFSTGRREAGASYRNHDVRQSQDYVINDKDHGVFAVFDGMGGAGGDPKAASKAAADAARDVLVTHGHVARSEDDIRAGLQLAADRARNAVGADEGAGDTVGTIMKFYRIDGKLVMGVVHAGDTRLFKYRPSDPHNFTALTPDQSVGHTVFNGYKPTDEGHSVDDFYAVDADVQPGDRYVLCSDGITGDVEAQFLTNEEFKQAFRQPTAERCAEEFMRVSKKDDDKSVLAIDVPTVS